MATIKAVPAGTFAETVHMVRDAWTASLVDDEARRAERRPAWVSLMERLGVEASSARGDFSITVEGAAYPFAAVIAGLHRLLDRVDALETFREQHDDD